MTRARSTLAVSVPRSRDEHPRVAHGGGRLAQRWVTANGCAAEPRTWPGIVDGAGHSATQLAWGSCRDGVEVIFWQLTAAGHVWPGADSYLPRLLGPPTKVLDANEEMRRFFARFTR
jgi:polyhydroxybutyrate depolymerase